MASSITLVGALVKVYMNNNVYTVTQTITLEVDYGEDAIYGIDSPWAQEISGSRASVKGSVKGVRIKNSGGLQAASLRPSFTDLAASPYISIRIQDRSTMEDIVFIPNAKITRESHTIAVKGVYKLDFDFIGQIPLFALDRS